MSIFIKHKKTKFGIGDKIKIYQKIKENDRERVQTFEGTIIAIKGKEENKSITVRKIGAAQIGIEKIFPISSNTIEKISLIKSGTEGVRRAKLYYLRNKPKSDLQKIYKRAYKRGVKTH